MTPARSLSTALAFRFSGRSRHTRPAFAPPAGFPTHPHQGMETVTFVLEGQMIHEDHTGGHGELEAGDIQFMTAGGGVLHSEMPGPRGVRPSVLWPVC